MKKLFTLLALFISIVSFSQIKEISAPKKELVGKISGMGIDFIELERWDDNTILIRYKDEKFSHINEYKSFSFKDVDGAYDALYNVILDGIQAGKKQTKTIELPNDMLTLEFKKSFGKGIVEIYHYPKGIPENTGKAQWIDEKRLKKLFNK